MFASCAEDELGSAGKVPILWCASCHCERLETRLIINHYRDISSSHLANSTSYPPHHPEAQISPIALLFQIQLPKEFGHHTSQ
jgi:hypothetical protein